MSRKPRLAPGVVVADGGAVKIQPDTPQEHLPGEEFGPTPAEQELGPLAKAYVSARDSRTAASQVERACKDKLMDACREQGMTDVTLPDGTQILVTTEHDVKVMRPKASKEDGDDAGDTPQQTEAEF